MYIIYSSTSALFTNVHETWHTWYFFFVFRVKTSYPKVLRQQAK